jgi:hypothetical protein
MKRDWKNEALLKLKEEVREMSEVERDDFSGLILKIFDEGYKGGFKESIEKGEQEKAVEIAKNFLSVVAKHTGLSLEDVRALLN